MEEEKKTPKGHLIIGLIMGLIIIAGLVIYILDYDKETISEVFKETTTDALTPNNLRTLIEETSDWEFEVINVDELNATLEYFGGNDFGFTPYSLDTQRTNRGSYRWKVSVNYTINDTYFFVEKAVNLNKNRLNQQFDFTMPDEIDWFRLSFGESSTVIEADQNSGATRYGATNEAICQASTGTLHATWRDAGSDLHYGNSTDGGSTWDVSEVFPGNIIAQGVICGPDDLIYLYYDSGSDIFIRNSSTAFATASLIVDHATLALQRPSCVVDGVGTVHCCAANNGLVYTNTTSPATVIQTLADATDDIDTCDIEVNENNDVFIVAAGTDQDQIEMFASPSNFTRFEILDTGTSWGSGDGLGIAIADDDQIYITFEDDATLGFCNSTVSSHNSSYTCSVVDTEVSHSPDIAVTENGDLYIVYQASDANTDNVTIYANSTDNGLTWEIRTQLAVLGGWSSFAQSTYSSGNRVNDLLHIIYVDDDSDVHHEFLSVEPPAAPGDTEAPVVNLTAPPNGTSDTVGVHSFNATATDNVNVSTMNFYIWNITGELVNNTNISTSGIAVGANITFTLPAIGTYLWNYQAIDNASTPNSAFNSSNFTIILAAADTCTYTSGNWDVAAADNCVISENVTIDTGGNVTCAGTGSFTILDEIGVLNWFRRHFEIGCYYQSFGSGGFFS